VGRRHFGSTAPRELIRVPNPPAKMIAVSYLGFDSDTIVDPIDGLSIRSSDVPTWIAAAPTFRLREAAVA
jgi:hypothetical protein